MKLPKFAAAAALLCAGLCAYAAPAQVEENTYEVTINSPALIRQFISSNEGLFYVEKRPFSLFIDDAPGKYSAGYLAKNGISGDIDCSSAFVSYNGEFIPEKEIEEIRVKKVYRETGFRRLRSKKLFYDIHIKGKGMFQSRSASILSAQLRYYGAKPVKCIYTESDKPAPQSVLAYPASVIIPRNVLAQQYLKDNLKKLNGKDLKQLKGSDKALAADIAAQAANFS